ncbi:uncharacterized protein LOC131252015 isoform X2 [Magnolia sinica]|uniref:uncharacterized protein LOC131252015 isoform X2 n=1 Tax=Magnolia sinica TaxID=86752 RepID=UPI00265AD256|nr:uncharacterized protein LOC131252015 isoform X2 [Magnolia sinica]
MQSHDFPFKEAIDLHSVETLANVDIEEPSWWVWVTHDMVPGNTEECSGIDNESYVIITEELLVNGVANFMVRSILANPKSKSLTPEELRKSAFCFSSWVLRVRRRQCCGYHMPLTICVSMI